MVKKSSKKSNLRTAKKSTIGSTKKKKQVSRKKNTTDNKSCRKSSCVFVDNIKRFFGIEEKGCSLFLSEVIPFVFGILWMCVGIFDEFSRGLTLEGLFYSSIVGLIIVIASVISWYHKLTGGIALLSIGIYAIFLISKADIIFTSKILMFLTLCLPLIIPGLYFTIRSWNDMLR